MSASHGYAGCCATCGGWLVLVADHPETRRTTAKEVARCVREGMEVKRITIEEGREMEMCSYECPGRES